MQNVFKFLASSFGVEDFFTASIALFIHRNDEFRGAFLHWVGDRSTEDLFSRSWNVRAQVAYPSHYGTAVLDMVLANPELELWFEHKLGARMGQAAREGESLQQLEKYLEAAARLMTARDNDDAKVLWPLDGPVSGRPRVLIFYITRRPEQLERSRYEPYMAGPRGYGLVWPAEGCWRWRDFWLVAKAALDGTLRGERGEFERTLALQFLNYWQELPAMTIQTYHDEAWIDLLPPPEALAAGDLVPFESYWAPVVHRVSSWGWRCTRGYHGRELYLSLADGPIDQVYVHPLRTVDGPEAEGWDEGLGHHVLRLLFRPRDPSVEWPAAPERALYEAWPARLGRRRVRDRVQLRLLVGIPNWVNCTTNEARKRAVAAAFDAAIAVFTRETGLVLQGVTPQD